ncbi:MAG TPA: helix-hairpin-helix domain-containing protein [Bacteroidales bacterium]|nr:helix-hairpin-helix domain-containing protein [Bacteroidales bacterium]
MKEKLRNLLSLSSGERKGVFVLFIVIFIILAVQAWFTFRVPRQKQVTDTAFLRQLDLFEQGLTQKRDTNKKTTGIENADYPETVYDEGENAELFPFDPNTVTAVEMKRLGFETRVIRTVEHYRQKGGRFRTPEDLNKIYGISPFMVNRLKPYIIISNTGQNIKPEPLLSADINRADSISLLKVKGIGPVLAGRIIKYRLLLGGFCNVEQLKEVYGMPDSVPEIAGKNFYADTSLIKRLILNTATEKDLARHPYIKSYAAKGIIRYREQVKEIKSGEELVKNGLLTREQYEKVKYYIKP